MENRKTVWIVQDAVVHQRGILPSASLHSGAGVAPDTLILESASHASWSNGHVSLSESPTGIKYE